MGIKGRMFLLVALLFAILYGVVTGIGVWAGAGSFAIYIVLAFVFIGIQYLVSPYIVARTMRVRWVSEKEAPELHRTVAGLAREAQIPRPRLGISEVSIPNAFAFGRTRKDGRVCVTRGILNLLNGDELKAVLGHEMSHIKNRDMLTITLLSGVPLVMYWIAWIFMLRGAFGGRGQGTGYAALIGLGAFGLYFLTNLLVMWGSRIREYSADTGSVRLGNMPHHLASALYKLTYGSARLRRSAEMKRVEGVRAFFLNDPSRAWYEIKELSQVDRDMNGAIDYDELAELRQKTVSLKRSEKMMELFSSHPNMLRRIKHLSSIIA